jgi:hypothetical protein
VAVTVNSYFGALRTHTASAVSNLADYRPVQIRVKRLKREGRVAGTQSESLSEPVMRAGKIPIGSFV